MVDFNDADQRLVGADPTVLALDDLRQVCDHTVMDLKVAHGWDDRDLRVVCVHRLRNVVQSVLANCVFRVAVFPSQRFWQTFFMTLPTADDMENHVRELDTIARFAAFQALFSCLESDARLIVRACDPAACNHGKAAAASILAWLIARVPTAESYSDFVKLLRLTRNTIHNNGTYYPDNGQNDQVSWKGIHYTFTVGQPINFANWSFVAKVAEDVLELMRIFVTDPVIAGLPRSEGPV